VSANENDETRSKKDDEPAISVNQRNSAEARCEKGLFTSVVIGFSRVRRVRCSGLNQLKGRRCDGNLRIGAALNSPEESGLAKWEFCPNLERARVAHARRRCIWKNSGSRIGIAIEMWCASWAIEAFAILWRVFGVPPRTLVSLDWGF